MSDAGTFCNWKTPKISFSRIIFLDLTSFLSHLPRFYWLPCGFSDKIVISCLFAICTNGPAQKIPVHSQQRPFITPPGPVVFVHSLSLVASSWNVVGLFCCALSLWQCLEYDGLHGVSSLPFRHLSSCGILMTRSPRVLCLQDWDTMTTVPQSRNFISLTNKRKEYSERRILG